MPNYRPPMRREDILYAFWNYSEFKELREGMFAYVKKEVPDCYDAAAVQAIDNVVCQVCLDAYRILDQYGPSDYVKLLSSNYVQRQLRAVALDKDGNKMAKENSGCWS